MLVPESAITSDLSRYLNHTAMPHESMVDLFDCGITRLYLLEEIEAGR
jgi:hypothetical protein